MSKLTKTLKEYSVLLEDQIGAKEFTNKIQQFENYLKSLDTLELKRRYTSRVLLFTENSYLFRSEMWDVFKEHIGNNNL